MIHPRVLLIGRNGQVGWELRRTLAPMAEVTAIDYPEIDLSRADSIREWVARTSPRVIINAAAHTAVDKAESEPEVVMALNGTAPGVLAEEARRLNAWFIHYSTDYVFDGTQTEAYRETDTPNPMGVYGRSKLAGDQAVQAADGLHLIFRLCWVYGLRGQNFLLTMQRLGRERETLRVIADQFGCPTWSRLIAETTALALQRTLSAPDPASLRGLYHLAASTHTTWHGFAEAIIGRLPAGERKCARIEAIPTSEYPTAARRPARSVLDCGKLERSFGLRLPGWDAMLALALDA